MSKTTYIVLAVIFVVLSVAGYVVYQTKSSIDTESVQTSDTDTTMQKTEDVTVATERNGDSDAQKSVSEVIAPTTVSDNPNGIHIMTDGKVMAKDGKVVAGATIREDGKIVLSDGSLITPVFDMRSDAAAKPVPTAPAVAAHVVYEVIGTDYEYDIKQIKVKRGDTVTINFKSEGGFHDWVVDELNAATLRVNEGEGSTSVTFVADTVGTFQYYCSVMNHRQQGMIGYLTVTEK